VFGKFSSLCAFVEMDDEEGGRASMEGLREFWLTNDCRLAKWLDLIAEAVLKQHEERVEVEL